MKKIYFILTLFLIISATSFGQKNASVEIVDPDGINYSGATVEVTGDGGEIYKVFYVKNTGSTTDFFYGREIVHKSHEGVIVQFCDENICYNTNNPSNPSSSEGLWKSPKKQLLEDSLYMFKPQLSPQGHSATAKVVYYVLDEGGVKLDSVTVLFTSTASIGKETSISFNIFPNPVKDVVTLSSEALKGGGRVVFTDALGKEVKRTSVSDESTTIDVSDLNRGVYFVNIISKEGIKSTVQRLIKQ